MSAPPPIASGVASGAGIPLIVNGAGGRVGAALCAAWAAARPAGLRPVWQSRTPRGPDWLPWGALPEGLEGGVLLHLAGATPTGNGVLEATVPLALEALEAARRAGLAHALLASSAAIYGRPAGAAPLDETTPPAPASAYGAAKRDMEDAVRRWRDATPGAPALTILRIGNVAGTDALAAGVAAASTAAPLELDRFADGTTPRRSYAGPATLAAIVAALARRGAGDALARRGAGDAPARRGARDALPDVLNLAAPGPGVEMGALLAARAALGHPVALRHRSARAGALRALVLDTGRLRSLVPLPPESGTAAEVAREWVALDRAEGAPISSPAGRRFPSPS